MTLAALFLQIHNPDQLSEGTRPAYGPVNNPTVIGSGRVDWPLHDTQGSVHASHASIQVMEDKYVLVDLCGHTYINHHTQPLGKMNIVALNHGDHIGIGKYRISLFIDDMGLMAGKDWSALRHLDLHQLMTKESALAPLVREGQSLAPPPAEPLSANPLQDWLHNGNQNPLEQLLHREPSTALSALAEPTPTASYPPRLTPHTDAHSSQHATFAMPTTQVPTMAIDTDAPPKTSAATDYESTSTTPTEVESQHLALVPLAQGLGIPPEPMSATEAQQFCEAAGRALRATLEGFLSLYQSEHGATQHSPVNVALLGRSYHPIEDNPLRMGQDVEATAKHLFSPQRSEVYLSPESAIKESMHNIKANQEAMMTAVQAGLWQVLEALSPANLEKRFAAYRQDNRSDATTWEMYKKYFDELLSSRPSHRQGGLEKMFWEVFEQHYDKTMRNQPQ